MSSPSHEDSLSNFIEFFRSDMTDYLKTNTKKHMFRSVVVGGYGLKLLLENKYNLDNKIRSKDLDITVSSYKSAFTDEQITQYIMNKITRFVRSQPNPKDYKLCIIQGSLYVPVLNYTRKAIIMLSYKYHEFVDIAITDAKIQKSIIDRPNSIKCGLPLKTINEYLLELLTIIYRSNVLNVSPELYEKRNPVSGYQSQKGLQDIDRAKLICSFKQLKKYKKYCNFINTISINKLLTSTPEERNMFFSALKSLLSLKRKITKTHLYIDNNTSQKVFI